jgi:hypothetical protein
MRPQLLAVGACAISLLGDWLLICGYTATAAVLFASTAFPIAVYYRAGASLGWLAVAWPALACSHGVPDDQ